MSGVYITGLEMPEKGTWLGLILYPDGGVREFLQPNKEYHAIPVPQHGRLIDADALTQSKECKLTGCVYQEEIYRAPTIIPAEREEVDNEPPES